MLKSISSNEFHIPASYISVGVAIIGLSWLFSRCLKASKQEYRQTEVSQKNYGKKVVICPKSSLSKDLDSARRIAQIAREIFPSNVKIVMQGTSIESHQELMGYVNWTSLKGVEVAEQLLDLSLISFEESNQMYVLHDSVPNLEESPSFPKEHIVDVGKVQPKSLSASLEQCPIVCLEESEIPESFQNLLLRRQSSLSRQCALLAGNNIDQDADWAAPLFFIATSLYAQKGGVFDLYLAGDQFKPSAFFSSFLLDLLNTISEHPNPPKKVQIVLPKEFVDCLSRDPLFLNNNMYEMELSEVGGNICEFVCPMNSASSRSLRILLPGSVSSQDLNKLHYLVQNQLLGDLGFSEWLSCESLFLDHLMETAKTHKLDKMKKFLLDFRRDVPKVFSYESCASFAESWMDPDLQKEAQTLRRMIRSEYELTQKEEALKNLIRQELVPLLSEHKIDNE